MEQAKQKEKPTEEVILLKKTIRNQRKEIKRLKEQWSQFKIKHALCIGLAETYMEYNEKLKQELEAAIKLPFKVGDTVYEANVNRNLISTYRVTAIIIGNESINVSWELIDGIYSNLNGFNMYAFGKTIFLTPEEADLVLKAKEKI